MNGQKYQHGQCKRREGACHEFSIAFLIATTGKSVMGALPRIGSCPENSPLCDADHILPSVPVGVFVNGLHPRLRQFAHQPVRLDWIFKPVCRPALADAASDGRGLYLLTIWIEKRQLSARLVAPKPEIFELRRCRPFGNHASSLTEKAVG